MTGFEPGSFVATGMSTVPNNFLTHHDMTLYRLYTLGAVLGIHIRCFPIRQKEQLMSISVQSQQFNFCKSYALFFTSILWVPIGRVHLNSSSLNLHRLLQLHCLQGRRYDVGTRNNEMKLL